MGNTPSSQHTATQSSHHNHHDHLAPHSHFPSWKIRRSASVGDVTVSHGEFMSHTRTSAASLSVTGYSTSQSTSSQRRESCAPPPEQILRSSEASSNPPRKLSLAKRLRRKLSRSTSLQDDLSRIHHPNLLASSHDDHRPHKARNPYFDAHAQSACHIPCGSAFGDERDAAAISSSRPPPSHSSGHLSGPPSGRPSVNTKHPRAQHFRASERVAGNSFVAPHFEDPFSDFGGGHSQLKFVVPSHGRQSGQGGHQSGLRRPRDVRSREGPVHHHQQQQARAGRSNTLERVPPPPSSFHPAWLHASAPPPRRRSKLREGEGESAGKHHRRVHSSGVGGAPRGRKRRTYVQSFQHFVRRRSSSFAWRYRGISQSTSHRARQSSYSTHSSRSSISSPRHSSLAAASHGGGVRVSRYSLSHSTASSSDVSDASSSGVYVQSLSIPPPPPPPTSIPPPDGTRTPCGTRGTRATDSADAFRRSSHCPALVHPRPSPPLTPPSSSDLPREPAGSSESHAESHSISLFSPLSSNNRRKSAATTSAQKNKLAGVKICATGPSSVAAYPTSGSHSSLSRSYRTPSERSSSGFISARRATPPASGYASSHPLRVTPPSQPQRPCAYGTPKFLRDSADSESASPSASAGKSREAAGGRPQKTVANARTGEPNEHPENAKVCAKSKPPPPSPSHQKRHEGEPGDESKAKFAMSALCLRRISRSTAKVIFNLIVDNHSETSRNSAFDPFLHLPQYIFGAFQFPTLEQIEKTLFHFMECATPSGSCVVAALILIERLVSVSSFEIHKNNWINVVYVAILVAQKILDDVSWTNEYYASLCATFSNTHTNELEIVFLRALKWDVSLSTQSYEKSFQMLQEIA